MLHGRPKIMETIREQQTDHQQSMDMETLSGPISNTSSGEAPSNTLNNQSDEMGLENNVADIHDSAGSHTGVLTESPRWDTVPLASFGISGFLVYYNVLPCFVFR